MSGKLQLKGAKHSIWDQIIVEVTKLWDFLNYVEDKRVLVINYLTKHEVANQIMQMRPRTKSHNSIVFFIHLSNQELATLNVHDRMTIIIRAKQFIGKNRLMDNVKTMVEEMKVEIEDFYKKFKFLFDKGIPLFWYNNYSLFNKDYYDNILVQQRVNHDKFQDMEGTLKGEDILNKLEDGFDILCQLKHIGKSLPPISFS